MLECLWHILHSYYPVCFWKKKTYLLHLKHTSTKKLPKHNLRRKKEGEGKERKKAKAENLKKKGKREEGYKCEEDDMTKEILMAKIEWWQRQMHVIKLVQ